MSEWTTEQIAEQFKLEVRRRFQSENLSHLAEERADIAKAIEEFAASGQPRPDWLMTTAHDSALWMTYEKSSIQIEVNSVRVILPGDWTIGLDFFDMFDGTEMAWSLPAIGAELVDGQPRVVIDLVLVDSWDDDRHKAWLAVAASALTTAQTLDASGHLSPEAYKEWLQRVCDQPDEGKPATPVHTHPVELQGPPLSEIPPIDQAEPEAFQRLREIALRGPYPYRLKP